LLVLAKPKSVARLLASDFPSENPRTQTRNFPYTKRCATYKKNGILIKKLEIMLGIWLSKKGKTKTLQTFLIASLLLIGIGMALLM
tara:strand:+ start:13304 stop:13561 length:258 start_codon:yes stop_codon:yes gene_type:complete